MSKDEARRATTMNRPLGLTLRGVGPLIQLLCLILLLALQGKGVSVVGIPLARLLFAGVVVGFLIWAAGMALQFSGKPPR